MTTIYIIIGIIAVVCYGFGIYYMKVRSNNKKAFLVQHPDAARILAQQVSFAIKQKTLTICSVDGQTPIIFGSGMHTGVLVTPGRHVLEVTFRTQRPGIMYRTVSTTYEPCKIEIEAEPNGNYELRFNEKAQSYELVKNGNTE